MKKLVEKRKESNIYVRNGNTEPTVTKSDTGRINNADFDLTTTGIKKFKINDWIGNAGDIYVWIYEEQTNLENTTKEHKSIVSGIKLERLETNKVGEKITATYLTLIQPHFYMNLENQREKLM